MEPRLIKDPRTDQAVQPPACSKPSVPRLTPILHSGTQPNQEARPIAPRRPSPRWASISVTMVSMVTYPSLPTNGHQKRRDSSSKQTLFAEGIEESISWHAITRHLCGKDYLIVCVTSRDNSRSSILRFACLQMSRLNRNLSKRPHLMWQPMDQHPLSADCARSCYCCHPLAPEILLASVLGGLSSTHPTSTPTQMLMDGWMWSLVINSRNSTEICSTAGWMDPQRPRNCFQLRFAPNPSPQHLPSLTSWLTRRLCLHDRTLSRSMNRLTENWRQQSKEHGKRAADRDKVEPPPVNHPLNPDR